MRIFGDDYPTPDGTCVRDYIHVADLARAHLLALDACTPGRHEIYNLGNGTGFSVKEVIEVCREVTGHPIPAEIGPAPPRRPGDPRRLQRAIQRELGWSPEHPSLQDDRRRRLGGPDGVSCAAGPGRRRRAGRGGRTARHSRFPPFPFGFMVKSAL